MRRILVGGNLAPDIGAFGLPLESLQRLSL